MIPTDTSIETALAGYERLIFRHSMRVVGDIEMDFDDIVAVYRIKAWQALRAFDPSRYGPLPRTHGSQCRCARCRFVFSCLKNMEKDLLKRKRRFDQHIEDIAPVEGGGPLSRDHFEGRYLSTSADDVYGAVEDDDVLLPSTLTELERRIVVLLYRDYSQAEIRRRFDLERARMDGAMRSIRLKMEDWRPSSAVPEPLPDLPIAA